MARDTHRLDQRNQRILDRYIYWTEERRIRFDDAITILADDEFFLSEETVMDIIRDMLRAGKKGSNGATATRPKFIGFKVIPRSVKRKASPWVEQSLFGDE